MFDKMINKIAAFDWITPSVAFVQDLLHGQVSDFGISAYSGWTARDIKRLLKQHGVRVWGVMLNTGGDILMFTVPEVQAKWAYYLLQREGVPLLSAPAHVVEAVQCQSRQTKTLFQSLIDFLDKMDEKF
jgi:hypothetical protein